MRGGEQCLGLMQGQYYTLEGGSSACIYLYSYSHRQAGFGETDSPVLFNRLGSVWQQILLLSTFTSPDISTVVLVDNR